MKPEVLYIAGMGRSGSTLLARVLGAFPGAVNLGEAAQFWTHQEMRRRHIPCSCGLQVADCPMWGTWWAHPPFEQDLGPTLSLRSSLRPGSEAALRPIGEGLAGFYRTVAADTGASLLVDASKHVGIARALATTPELPIRFVHLVRDPRGVAGSRAAQKEYLEAFSPRYVGLRWLAVNLAAQALAGRSDYRLLRYESFVADPDLTIRQMLAGTALESAASPVSPQRTVTTGVQHALAGNPDKFDKGKLQIRPGSPARPNGLVTAMTAPLLPRYGYRWRLDS
jgi:hypothetical protein